MKKILAMLLTLSLLLGMAPAALAAEEEQPDPGSVVAAEEVSGSRLDDADWSGSTRADVPGYAYDDMVTVIVQLDEPAVMDYYGMSTYSADEDMSAGEAVSAFLNSEDALAYAQELLEGQQAVLDEIGGQQVPLFSLGGASAAVEVTAQWTTLINGMAIRIPYGQLETIRSLDGVKRAYVEHTYEEPTEPATTGGTEGYSYDMVGLGEAWAEGYTGEGMVVAVLDTGLDIEWASYWDDDANSNVTGIRRAHEAFRDDSFKSDDPDVRFTEDGMQDYLASLQESDSLNAFRLSYASLDAYYKNLKVPFAFDYAGTTDPYTGEVVGGDVNVRPTESNHGTHVAGTIAGYAETGEGEVKFTGVAPDAQLLIMKVFADVGGGATDSSIINALEDALKLKADIINLSLGADNGFAEDDTAAAEIYAKVAAAGIVMMTSAGNAAYSSATNQRGDYYLSDNSDMTMMSSPAIYDSNLAVAAINNSVQTETTLVWSDGENEYVIAFSDPNEVAMKSTFSSLGEEGIEIIPVPGTGTYSDYYSAGFRSYYGYSDKGVSGIALVKRGELSFVDKINNATQFTWSYYDSAKGYYVTECPVKAVIIYDNDPESTELISMGVDGAALTSCFISGVDGAAIAAAAEEGKTVTLKTVNKIDRVSAWDEAGEMSEFSSWGAGPGLELKPEITAPGGNIWSSVMDSTYREQSGIYDDYDGSYSMMSGTSMAAPHMSGLGALVRQYVRESQYTTTENEGALASQLLVSTALPQTDGSGVYYSPRLQGAGLVNVGAAVSTPAYITVNGQSVGKLELGDDASWSGQYPFSFRVNNLTAGTLIYNAEVVVLRPATETVDGETYVVDSDVLVKKIDLGTVTVPAGGATVSGTISLTGAEIAGLRELFPNGTYIEGFIVLTDASGSNPQIGLPYLAFLGDWTAAPIFDSALWTDGCTGDENDPNTEDGADPWNGDYTWGVTTLGSCIYSNGEVINFLNLGQNVFDDTSAETQTLFHKENLTISPNGDGYLDLIDDVELYQLRDAKLIVVQVWDEETGALYFSDYTTFTSRTVYSADYGMPIPMSLYYFPSWDGTDLEGSVLPSGTKCVYTITAYGEGDYGEIEDEELGYLVSDFESVVCGEKQPTFNGHTMDMTGDVISFPVTVDTVAPKLENNAVTIYEDEDGRVWLEGTVYDEDGSLATVDVFPVVIRSYNTAYNPYADPTYFESGLDYNNPFYSESIYDAGAKTWTFRADVTEYAHTNEAYYGENYTYSFDWTGNVYVSCGDYGANERNYAIKVKDMTAEGILLSQTSALLHVGDTFELSVVNNSGSDETIVRTSSNPEVATIDEYGHVAALAPGQTIITVSCGSSSAICVVAVEEYPTEVIDFDLSIEHFEGLKAGVPITVEVTNLQPADVVIDEISWKVYEDDEDWAGLVNVYQNSRDALSGQIELVVSYSAELIPAGSGYLEVTINGVTRKMTFTWEDVPTSSAQDDLMSAANYGEQTVYVTQGETATLVAKYKQSHSFIPVELYTMEGYQIYSYTNPTTAATGLVLDGPNFAANSARWEGKLVAQEGYTLPDSIKVLTRYTDSYMYGYETEMYCQGTEMPEWAQYGYSYNPTTGEIVAYAPYGATNIMVIRADGVATEGAPAGQLSGNTYTRPDATYGPFDWTFTGGVEGTLETFENRSFGTEYCNGADFTPSEPGVSYITATSKDGQYSVNFAVVCLPVKAESIDLEAHSLTMSVGEASALHVSYDPEPTLESDKELIITSFDESVVRVKNGNLVAIAPGVAFVKIALKTDTTVQTYCVVTVTKAQPGYQPPVIIVDPIKPVEPITPVEPAPQPDEPTFMDVPATHWAYDAVETAVDLGLFEGVSDTRFDPNGTMNRAMMVTVLWRLEGEPAASYTGAFGDVARGTWYSAAVEWASANGIVTGVSEDAFAPDGKVTREQIATILWRLEGKPIVTGNLLKFSDGSQVSEYAEMAMIWATSVGLFSGDANGNLRPGDAASRAEVAVLMQRYITLFR